MAFWLNRSGRQLVRLSSSSWASPQKLRALTSVNNCFSTASAASSSSGGMKRESKLKVRLAEYLASNDLAMVNASQNKPLPSGVGIHKFLDDGLDDETKDPASETDEAVENPKIAFTPEMIKAASALADCVHLALLKYLPTPVFKANGDNFNFTLDTNGLYLTVNVSGLAKEHLVVWVMRDCVLVKSLNSRVAPDQKVLELICLPEDYDYDPDEVTGTFMEDGLLQISFPVSKEVGEPKEKYFAVNLV